ncbi:hypothetical protein F4811DRAFT_538480 [Daldinia bambusicola]|nr:hypothetical protein F4811DRAFT_538480 [Daldinia bambusicola]
MIRGATTTPSHIYQNYNYALGIGRASSVEKYTPEPFISFSLRARHGDGTGRDGDKAGKGIPGRHARDAYLRRGAARVVIALRFIPFLHTPFFVFIMIIVIIIIFFSYSTAFFIWIIYCGTSVFLCFGIRSLWRVIYSERYLPSYIHTYTRLKYLW